MIACCTFLWLLWAASAQSAHTYTHVDPASGKQLTCEKCPPGQFLRQRCTASTRSQCEDCPPGSFTALWNHISRCLSCGVCGRNMVKSRECSPQNDCSCECRRGYYYKERAGMCTTWRECGTGHGVTVTGSPHQDTECAPCSDGTFSNRVSSVSGCSAHSVCQAPRSEVILKGTAWHDAICASCEEAHSNDAAHFLRRLLPSFFTHHSLALRRLKHLLGKLPRADGAGKLRRSVSGLTQDQLKARLDQWVGEASPAHLRSLPAMLTEVGAAYTAERLTHKLNRIEHNLRTNTCQTATVPPTATEPGPQTAAKPGPQTTTKPGSQTTSVLPTGTKPGPQAATEQTAIPQ